MDQQQIQIFYVYKEINLKIFLNHALKLDADYVATGHYASIKEKNRIIFISFSKG